MCGRRQEATLGSGNRPSKVQSPWSVTLSFTKIAVGDGHTYGISGGSSWCWGRNESGQLGLGTTDTWLTYPSYAPSDPNWSPNLGITNPAKVSGT